MSPFLAADTKAKVRILGRGDDHLAALSAYIDVEQIPDFLGGRLATTISDGSDDATARSESPVDVGDVSATPAQAEALSERGGGMQ